MTATTTETLTVGGLLLNTLGTNVDLWASTIGMSARSPRHEIIPKRPGALRRPSQVLPTDLDLSMWVTDRTADGAPGGTGQMWTNLDALLDVVATNGEYSLSKVRNSATGLMTLTGNAETTGPIQHEQLAPLAVRVIVPMIMAYPYWEGAAVNQTVTGGGGAFTNDGHANADKITLTMEAGGSGWVNPSFENTANGTVMTYSGTVTASKTYTIDLWEGTVVNDTGDSISGALDLNDPFFSLIPGSNTVNLTQTSGGGTFRAVFLPPYVA